MKPTQTQADAVQTNVERFIKYLNFNPSVVNRERCVYERAVGIFHFNSLSNFSIFNPKRMRLITSSSRQNVLFIWNTRATENRFTADLATGGLKNQLNLRKWFNWNQWCRNGWRVCTFWWQILDVEPTMRLIWCLCDGYFSKFAQFCIVSTVLCDWTSE